MEDQATTQLPSGSSAAAYPRWVMLSHDSDCEAHGSYSTADAKTLVTGRTSTGYPVGVSLRLAAPPAESRVCVHFPPGIEDRSYHGTVVAAHGDSVLIHIFFETRRGFLRDTTADYFVYNAGAAAADPPRPPSLSLLPPCCVSKLSYYLSNKAIGLLRRGADVFVMAHLEMVQVSADSPTKRVAELQLIRSGKLSMERPVMISHGGGDDGDLLSSWRTHTVVPIAGRLLAFVDLTHGLMLSDVFDDKPVLRHVPFPVVLNCGCPYVCGDTGSVVKLIYIYPRCCCGGAASTECPRSHHAYIVKTWTLRMDDMVWVMDGMVDATELWALDAYEGLPRVSLACPVMSLDDPHIISFMLCEGYFVKGGDQTEWSIMVDIRSKELLSVYRYPKGQCYFRWKTFIPSRISDCLNPYPNCNNGKLSASKGDMESPVVIFNKQLSSDASSSVLKSFCKTTKETMDVLFEAATPEEAILATLKEIPDLARADMLKAYSVLNHDSNGRRLRSLLGLPMDLRKDWLLMEIKAGEACSICSACTADLQHT
ncbi:hypothetical protein ACP70R_004010 [Stipagrostis hirtigluma subsp. patula]